MSTDHELRLKIDAAPARKGASEFTAAIDAVKRAVRDLERDSAGAFTALKNIKPQFDVTPISRASAAIDGLGAASDRALSDIRKLALQSANALRVSTDQASRLRDRLLSVADTDGLAKLEARLSRLRTSLIAATSGLDVREARAGYADLASELNRTAREAERLSAIAIAEERALEDAGKAATTHAEALQRLRAAHDPLFASSQRYAAALREIDQLVESNTVSEASASAMRERAAQTYLTLGSAADASAAAMKRNSADTMQGVMAGQQLYDVLIMGQMGFQSIGVIAMQQGSQLAAQMNTIKASGGSVFKTLVGGFTSLLNPLSLVVIGGTAVVAMLAQWAFSASEAEDHAKTFRDALDEVATATERFATAAEAASAPARDIIENYGSASSTIREFLAAVAEGEKMQMLGSVTTSIVTLKNEFLELREYATGNWLEVPESVLVFKDAAVAAGDAAGTLRQALVALSTAKGPQAQYEATLALKRALDEAASANGGLNAEQRVLYDRVVAVGAELGNVIGATDGATSATYAWAGAMSSVRAEIAAILSSLAALGGSVISNAGKRAELTALQAGKTVREAEVARLRFNHEQEMSAREMGAGNGVKGWINRRVIDAERFQFDEGIRLDDDLNVARSAARKSESGSAGGSGGRTGALSEEAKATAELTANLKDRLSSLEAERVQLAVLASGQFETAEAAQLFAEAMVAGGGAVDSQTAAMIAQIDAATKLNAELQKLARDPVKEWMDSVPSWIEAGKQIEMGAIDSLKTAISDFIKTGKFDLESLGEAILGTFADVIADKATKELMTLLGRGEPGSKGLGGLFGGLFSSAGDTEIPGMGGDAAAIATGGQQAGTTIATSMTTAGQQVAADLAAAMTQGGSQAGASVQGGLAAGSNNVRTAAQGGLASGATNVRMAAVSGGESMRQGVVAGGEAAGNSIATKMSMAGGGGGGGGGMFSFESIAGMLIGAFSEGGMSNAPVGFSSVSPSAFRNAPHFSQGTANTSGIPAMLHDNEAVIPLSKGRKIGVELNGDSAGGGTIINAPQTITINTPDADSFRRSRKQVASDMARAGQAAVRQNG